MIQWLICTLSLLFYAPAPLLQQGVRVATYSTGKINTDAYEGLSFWVKNDQRAYIRYAHGKDDTEEIDLTWSGLEELNGVKAFRAQFPEPDTRRWYIIQKGATLQVMDRAGNYGKVYAWENENASGDPTTTCSFCAQNEQEAMEIMKKYFFR